MHFYSMFDAFLGVLRATFVLCVSLFFTADFQIQNIFQRQDNT